MKAAASRKLVREAGFFVIANLLAGLFNYLYQVSASKQLSRAEFADVSSWVAHVSVFLLVAGILQYAGNFFPARRMALRRQIIFINLLTFGMLVLFFTFSGLNPLAIGALTVSVGLAVGWVTGQAQFRLMFNLLGAVNILSAFTKLVLVLLPNSHFSLLERYYIALLLGSVPSLWLLSASLWPLKAEPTATENSGHNYWLAPIILSAATAVIPQFDLVVLRRSVTAEAFEDFARASLFYKGVFFLFMIAAQWLLPRQIQAKGKIQSPAMTSFRLIPIAIIGSVLMTVAAPPIAQMALGWASVPPLEMIFLSCFNMCLLTWLFLLIQEFCARGRPRPAALAFGGLLAEGVLQLSLHLNVTRYLSVVTIAQGLIVYSMIRLLKAETRHAVA